MAVNPGLGVSSPEMLNQPPPSPQLAAAGGTQPSMPQPSMAALAGGQSVLPEPAAAGILALGEQIDKSLLALASASPIMAVKLGEARELVQQAVADFLQSLQTGTGAAVGTQWPGGGFSAGQPFPSGG